MVDKLKIRPFSDEELGGAFPQNIMVSNANDFNLKYTHLKAYEGGLHDPDIFGSSYENKCNCGHTNIINRKCHSCGVVVMEPQEWYGKYGIIDSEFYFSIDVKARTLLNIIKEHLVVSPTFEEYEDIFKVKSLDIFNLGTFTYADKKIHVSTEVDDITDIGYEGLLKVLKAHYPSLYLAAMKLVNRYIYVAPTAFRPVKYFLVDGKKKLVLDKMNLIYRSIIYMKRYVLEKVEAESDLEAMKLMLANYRMFLSRMVIKLSDSLKTTKESNIRKLMSKRIPESGRAVIVPDLKIGIDEVSLPINLAYELYQIDFRTVLIEKYKISTEEAIEKIREASPTTIELFKKEMEGKVVVINRAPTLHRFNLMAMKVKFNDNYTIGIPPLVCKPFNADFDGDTMSFYRVPEGFTELVLDRMSPKKLLYYDKNLEEIFVPTNEMLAGLKRGTVYKAKEPITLDTAEEMMAMYKKREIYIDTPVIIGDIKTTPGREKVSKILGVELNEIIGEDEPINPENIKKILAKVNVSDDRLDIIKKLQDFAILIIRLYGIRTVGIKDLYQDIKDEEVETKIRQIIESNKDDSQKSVEVFRLYQEYIKKSSEKIREVYTTMDEKNLASFAKILTPLVAISKDGKAIYHDSNIVKGMSKGAYDSLAGLNRLLLAAKQSSVGQSGDLTRQLMLSILSYITFTAKFDEDNVGLELPANECIGRYDIDNNVIKSGGTSLVKVNSWITADRKLYYRKMSRSHLSDKYDSVDGAIIGSKFSTGITESLTQSGLSVKHGGASKIPLPEDDMSIIAKFDGVVESSSENLLVLKGSEGSYEKRFIPHGFVLENKEFKSGDRVGKYPRIVDRSYTLNAIIKFLGAILRGEKSEIDFGCSYAPISGVISYELVEKERKKDKLLPPKKEKYVSLKIGDKVIDTRLDNRTYCFYSEGEEVQVNDRISTAVLDVNVYKNSNTSVVEVYMAFRDQFKRLHKGLRDELIEFLFVALSKYDNLSNYEGFLGVGKSETSTENRLLKGNAASALGREVKDHTLEYLKELEGEQEEKKEDQKLDEGSNFADILLNMILGQG